MKWSKVSYRVTKEMLFLSLGVLGFPVLAAFWTLQSSACICRCARTIVTHTAKLELSSWSQTFGVESLICPVIIVAAPAWKYNPGTKGLKTHPLLSDSQLWRILKEQSVIYCRNPPRNARSKSWRHNSVRKRLAGLSDRFESSEHHKIWR
jgi:hypothetical protein